MNRDRCLHLKRAAAAPTEAALRTMEAESTGRGALVLATLRRRFDDPCFRVAEAVRALGASTWFFAACRQLTGLTPAALVRECRMETAARLLRDTTLPVAEVAFLVGYEDVGTLQRLCREWCGLSPSRYRARARQMRPRLLELGDDVMTWWYWRRVVEGELDEPEVRRILGFFDAVYGSPAEEERS